MTPPTGITRFQCNVCGAECQFPLDQLRRETASCNQCHSSPRIRALVDLPSRQLTGQSRTIAEFPTQKNIRGLGLTDPDSIASRLAKKFDYQNTYFHQPPRLDIKGDLDSSQLGSYDFVISSAVFEHVLPPVRTAFVNVFRLLKPGGLLAFPLRYPTAFNRKRLSIIRGFTISKSKKTRQSSLSKIKPSKGRRRYSRIQFFMGAQGRLWK